MSEPNQVCTEADVQDMIARIGDGIIKDHRRYLEYVVLVGIVPGGNHLIHRVSDYIKKKTNEHVPVGKLDVALYYEDLINQADFIETRKTEVPFKVDNKIVILLVDILHTGRDIRAALNIMTDFGPTQRIELAAFVDRGGREMPVEPKYIGKKIDISANEEISVKLFEVFGEDSIYVSKREGALLAE